MSEFSFWGEAFRRPYSTVGLSFWAGLPPPLSCLPSPFCDHFPLPLKPLIAVARQDTPHPVRKRNESGSLSQTWNLRSSSLKQALLPCSQTSNNKNAKHKEHFFIQPNQNYYSHETKNQKQENPPLLGTKQLTSICLSLFWTGSLMLQWTQARPPSDAELVLFFSCCTDKPFGDQDFGCQVFHFFFNSYKCIVRVWQRIHWESTSGCQNSPLELQCYITAGLWILFLNLRKEVQYPVLWKAWIRLLKEGWVSSSPPTADLPERWLTPFEIQCLL